MEATIDAAGRLAKHDQRGTSDIGAFPIAVACDMGYPVAYLPGPTMRRIADPYPGAAKTDARDAFVIADTARSMRNILRSIKLEDETWPNWR